MLVAGRVWSHDTRKPLPWATLDVWQANSKGRYDNDDSRNPPGPTQFENRSRVVTDETGFYEFETIHPGRYLNGGQLRPAHIHYRVEARGHQRLITQLYFEGDPHIAGDPFVDASLIMPIREVQVDGGTYEAVTFDIVLAADA